MHMREIQPLLPSLLQGFIFMCVVVICACTESSQLLLRGVDFFSRKGAVGLPCAAHAHARCLRWESCPFHEHRWSRRRIGRRRRRRRRQSWQRTQNRRSPAVQEEEVNAASIAFAAARVAIVLNIFSSSSSFPFSVVGTTGRLF